MKRTNADRGNADRGGGGLGKRQRNSDGYAEALAEGKFELRFLLPTKCAGAVIGRGGEKIKAIREKYSALLTVPDKSAAERVFTMVVAQESLTDCFQEVLANLSEFKELKNKKEEFEIRILIHQSMAGAIIGRKGEKIKELREQTGANLKVFSECAPMSTDRVLLISAPQEKLPEVVKQMIEFMKEIPIKGVTKQYDAVNYDPRMAATYGGYPSGNGGSGNFSGPPPMQRNVDPFDNRGGFDPMRGQAGGYGAQPAYGSQPGGYGDYNRQPYGGGVGGGGNAYITGSNATPYGAGARGPPPQVAGGNGGYDATTTQVTIPDELAGTIIGKGGERINRIRQDSGARIDVGSSYGNNERIITITGTPHQIQSAQYYLQQSVRTSEAGRRYLQNQR